MRGKKKFSAKMADFETLNSPTLISRKIGVIVIISTMCSCINIDKVILQKKMRTLLGNLMEKRLKVRPSKEAIFTEKVDFGRSIKIDLKVGRQRSTSTDRLRPTLNTNGNFTSDIIVILKN